MSDIKVRCPNVGLQPTRQKHSVNSASDRRDWTSFIGPIVARENAVWWDRPWQTISTPTTSYIYYGLHQKQLRKIRMSDSCDTKVRCSYVGLGLQCTQQKHWITSTSDQEEWTRSFDRSSPEANSLYNSSKRVTLQMWAMLEDDLRK